MQTMKMQNMKITFKTYGTIKKQKKNFQLAKCGGGVPKSTTKNW